MSVSVCTIARGRDVHLHNLILGLSQQSMAPTELVVAHMQATPYEGLPDTDFPIRQILVGGARAPLAAARNAAASAAKCDQLVFLDVDCVPMPGLIGAYCDNMGADRCLMGETRYLAKKTRLEALNADTLWDVSAQHPARRFEQSLGSGVQLIPEALEFWSLSFALPTEAFWAIAGFDEIFEGYGGEDTDFAMRLGQSNIGLFWVPEARAVHQWHAVEKPPLTHLEDIVRNANLFRQKHGTWCMDYWLNQFAEAGFIIWREDLIEIIRQPSADERQAALCDGSVRFS